MSTYLIHQALTQSIVNLGITLGVTIAHEQADFDRDKFDGDEYIDLFNLPSDREPLTKDGYLEDLGIYQIGYFRRAGKDIGPTLQDIDTILEFYKENQRFCWVSRVMD